MSKRADDDVTDEPASKAVLTREEALGMFCVCPLDMTESAVMFLDARTLGEQLLGTGPIGHAVKLSDNLLERWMREHYNDDEDEIESLLWALTTDALLHPLIRRIVDAVPADAAAKAGPARCKAAMMEPSKENANWIGNRLMEASALEVAIAFFVPVPESFWESNLRFVKGWLRTRWSDENSSRWSHELDVRLIALGVGSETLHTNEFVVGETSKLGFTDTIQMLLKTAHHRALFFEYGTYALCAATTGGRVEAVKLLLSLTDLPIGDSGFHVVSAAVDQGHKEIFDILRADSRIAIADYMIPLVNQAIRSDKKAMLEHLLSLPIAKCDKLAPNDTPLHVAMFHGNHVAFRRLLTDQRVVRKSSVRHFLGVCAVRRLTAYQDAILRSGRLSEEEITSCIQNLPEIPALEPADFYVDYDGEDW